MIEEFYLVARDAVGSIYQHELAVFAVACTFIAIFIWFLDWITTLLFNRSSLLGVGFGGMKTFQSLVLWGFGAGVAAYLGGLAELLNIGSTSSKVIVGIAWPTILPRLITLAANKGEPEQQDQAEEEDH